MGRLGNILAVLVALGLGVALLWALTRSIDEVGRGVARTGPVVDAGDVARPAPMVRAPQQAEPDRHAPLPSATSRADAECPFGAIEGRVLSSADAAPVADAELTFMRDGAATTVLSDNGGAFTLTAYGSGRYELVAATCDGYLPYAPEWGHSQVAFRARAGQRIVGAAVYLTPAVEYVVRVVDPSGAPVEGAEVLILDGTGVASAGAAPVILETRFVTGPRGETRLHAPDFALLEARKSPFQPTRARLDVAAQIAHAIVLALGAAGAADKIRRDQVIAGVVVNGQGEPLAEALVTAGGPTPRRGRRPVGRSLSGADGRFELRGLDGGHYVVDADYPGLARARAKDVATGTRNLRLRLLAGGAIAGTVREARGRAPVAAYRVSVALQTGPLTLGAVVSKAVYDAAGRYEFRGLAPGAYMVEASARGFAAARHRGIEVRAQAPSPANADLMLEHGGTIVGVVVDAQTAAPIADARVSVEVRNDDGPSVGDSRRGAITSAAGRFSIHGVAAGLRSLTVVAVGYDRLIVSGVRADNDRETEPTTIELSPVADGVKPKLELAGIGVQIAARGEALRVGRVFPGGGAAAAGLVNGDLILEVDGERVVDLGFDGALQQIRGPVDTVVELTIRRAHVATPFVVNIVRKKIRV